MSSFFVDAYMALFERWVNRARWTPYFLLYKTLTCLNVRLEKTDVLYLLSLPAIIQVQRFVIARSQAEFTLVVVVERGNMLTIDIVLEDL